MRTKSRCMHGDEGALDGGGEDHVRDEQEPAQTSAPVSTTTAALAGSEDNSPPPLDLGLHREGRFRSLSPSARGLPSPLETARALIAASDRKEALTGRRVMRRAGEKGGATQEGGEKKREGKVRLENFSQKKNWTAG